MTDAVHPARDARTAKYLADESAARESLAMLPEAVRQRLDAWQAAQSEWFNGTVLEIVAEYIAWDDARRIEAEAVPVVTGDSFAYRTTWDGEKLVHTLIDPNELYAAPPKEPTDA
jgi:hypothetical protein